ncbi:metallophosphoesterase family protein [Dehalobacterium formicoaceticum]|uniref:Phosphoesterase n=1 Tax=Dehalobacterium formicoaceticum TaxID=51515 RepID=A0ABT1XZQ7_9FIRM|nr:metallophosphoesterase family protein [Dehalobacterium formicoaceticum]MCR6544102.1 metallophosphatase family protein [Dehalobacterium formicoaceticum]
MIIGVLSDSHIPGRANKIPAFIWQAFAEVDLILHAGDIVDERVLIDLNALAPVEAVYGNMDQRNEYHIYQLTKKKIIAAGNKKIGLIHGDGSSGSTLQRAAKAFSDDEVDCVVFGHSHQPFNEVINGVLMFNPGSCTNPRREPQPSCGILYVGKDIKGEVLYFDKQGN